MNSLHLILNIYLAIFRNSLKFFAGLSPCEIRSKPLVDFASCWLPPRSFAITPTEWVVMFIVCFSLVNQHPDFVVIPICHFRERKGEREREGVCERERVRERERKCECECEFSFFFKKRVWMKSKILRKFTY